MRYAFIERHRRVWPISVQCRVLKVSVSGFHQHRVRRRKIAERRHLSDEALLAYISAVYAESKSAYGWPAVLNGPHSGQFPCVVPAGMIERPRFS